MSILANIWMTMAGVYVILFYVGIVVALILLERYFIKKRSKGEWILPVISLVLALVVVLSEPWGVSTFSGNYIDRIQIHQNNRIVGVLQYMRAPDLEAEFLGDYVTNEGKDSRFIQLKLDKDGHVLDSSEPLSPELIARIEDEIEHFAHVGEPKILESKPYGELVKTLESCRETETTWTLGGFLQRFAYYGILPLVLFGMWLTERQKRKKKNAFNKARLKDL